MGSFNTRKIEKLKNRKNIKGLVKALSYQEARTVREAAARALGQIGDVRAVEPLIAALRDKARDVRKAAAWSLALIGDVRAVEPLIAVLKEKDEYGHWTVTEALGMIGDTRAVEPLIAVLKDKDKDNNVRKAAAKALGKIGDTRALEPLISALRDNILLCSTAAIALGEIGAPAVEPLIACLRDEDWTVRKAAARALGEIGDTRAVEPLITALRDKDSDTRKYAADGLNKLGWHPDRGTDGAAYWIAQKKWDRCVDIGEPAVELLIATLRDGYGDVPSAAAKALGEIGDARAMEPLIATLRDGDGDVRRTAAKALVSLYSSGNLDDHNMQTILALRSTIMETSRGHSDGPARDCGGRHDDFAGDLVEFPL